jgi:ABC-type dipeptide/oligopeptide/nickel transport system permease subunit
MTTEASLKLEQVDQPGKRTKVRELQIFWRRFSRNKAAVIGLIVVMAVLFSAFFAPWLAPEPPWLQDLARQNATPSWKLPFGADQLGRNILSRVIYGGRVALEVGAVSVFSAVIIGLLIGMTAGYFRGWIDEVFMRTMDVLLAFPYLLLAIAIVAAIGPGLINTMIAIAVWLTPTYARLSRGVVLSVKEAYYVEAAKAIGARAPGIIWRHLLPNCLTPILVQITLDFARAILMEAGLSFLGYGVLPPTASWGNMIAEGRNELLVAPHIASIPGFAILLTVLSLNLVGDGLREALDPKRH